MTDIKICTFDLKKMPFSKNFLKNYIEDIWSLIPKYAIYEGKGAFYDGSGVINIYDKIVRNLFGHSHSAWYDKDDFEKLNLFLISLMFKYKELYYKELNDSDKKTFVDYFTSKYKLEEIPLEIINKVEEVFSFYYIKELYYLGNLLILVNDVLDNFKSIAYITGS